MIATPRPHDLTAIEALLRAAFGQQDEADLVETLRRNGDMVLERVAVIDARVAGYIGVSRMRAPEGWLCLAPVAVQPERQNAGIGSALVRAALEAATGPVVVLGDPGYYGELGFDRHAARNLTSPFPVSHTLLTGAEGAPDETLVYPRAFGR